MTPTEQELNRAYQDLQNDVTLTPARLRRAFELVQTQAVRPYDTTESSCTCPDHMYRNVVCKHMTALRLKNATLYAAQPQSIPASPADVDPETGLAELRRIRTAWLETAERNGDFDAIFAVMHAYGVITTAKSWVFVENDIKATLTITGWRQSDYTLLTVEVAGRVVCKETRAQGRYANPNPNAHARLFIPGAWVEVFRKHAQTIRQNEIHQRLTGYEAERQNMLRELGIQ